MRIAKLRFAAIVFPMALVAQPYSTSMAQCAGLYEALSVILTRSDRKETTAAASEAYFRAAVVQAEAEGDTALSILRATRADTRDEWVGKGSGMAFSQDDRDWASYCHSFAKDQGIALGF